jgi:hypothetical protein
MVHVAKAGAEHSAVNPISGAEGQDVESGHGWHGLLQYQTLLAIEESRR